METNIDNNMPSSMPDLAKKKNIKIYILVLLVILFLAVTVTSVVVWRNFAKNNFKPELNSWMPQGTQPKDARLKDYQVGDPAVFILRKGEEYQAGKSYEISKPYMEAVKEIVLAMNTNGWAATTGSKQDESQTILKINNGKETLFIVVKKITNEKSEVIIVPVEKNK